MYFYHLNVNLRYESTLFMKKITDRRHNICISLNEPNIRALATLAMQPNVYHNMGSVLIFTRNIRTKLIPSSVPNIVIVKVLNRNLLVISVYLKCTWLVSNPRSIVLLMSQLQKLRDDFPNHSMIVMGDFNCTDPMWSGTTCARPPWLADIIKTFIRDNNMRLVNDDKIPTYDSGSTIDLMLVTQDIIIHSKKIISMQLSDHYTVFANLQVSKNQLSKIKRRIIITHWAIKDKWPQQQLAIQWFKNDPVIQRCLAIIYHPERNGLWKNNKNKSKFWRRKSYRSKVRTNYSLIELLKQHKDPNERWNIINKYIMKSPPGIDWSNKESMRSRDEWLSSFSSERPIYKDFPQNIPGSLTLRETDMIKAMKFTTSSLSADNFTKRTWSRLFKDNKLTIINTIEEIFKFSHVPHVVTTLGCGFVPKANSEAVRMVKSPNYLYKIIDQILKDRILSRIDDLIDLSIQYAYTPSKSREHMIMSILKHEAFTNAVALIQLDVSKAFDTVKAELAMEKIRRTMDSSTAALIASTLEHRYVIYDSKDKRLYKKELLGVPQGTATGPLLFIIAIDEALKALRSQNILIWSYADDMMILIPRSQRKLETYIMSEVTNCLAQCSLHINHSKTKRIDKKMITKGFCILGEHFVSRKYAVQQYQTALMKDTRNFLNTEMKMNWSLLKYLPFETTKLIINTVICPRLAKREFIIFVLCSSDEERERCLQSMIKVWGKVVKTVLGLSRLTSSTLLYVKYALTILNTKLKAVLRINSLNYGTTEQPPLGNFLPSMTIAALKHKHYGPWKSLCNSTQLNTKLFRIDITTDNGVSTGYQIILPTAMNKYHAELAIFETILKKHENEEMVIILSKEMTKWGMGNSNFAKSLQMIMYQHTHGKWSWWSHMELPIQRPQFLETFCADVSPTLLSEYKRIDREVINIIQKAWMSIDSIWPLWFPQITKSDSFKIIKLNDQLIYRFSTLECCPSYKSYKSIYKHLIYQCEWTGSWIEDDIRNNPEIDNLSKASFGRLLEIIEILNLMIEANDVLKNS